MGFKYINILMPTDYSSVDLFDRIKKQSKLSNFSYTIDRKSLDARNKRNIHWNISIGVSSDEINANDYIEIKPLIIEFQKKKKHVIIIGSGPAGIFSAYVLQLSGFNTTIIEQGSTVIKRIDDIKSFESTGTLNENSNYAFGEGGAGTFSDGKLTSRSKNIKLEKKFIFDTYTECGAPEEINYLAHPHIGTDNLQKIVINLRDKYESIGGRILFDTEFVKINKSRNNKYLIDSIETNSGLMKADYFILATGHSSYKAYRSLISSGVPFRSKPFAIGTRVEHQQVLINKSQWGTEELKGVKAAEYKLTSKSDGFLPVYSFCMCPGGKVVPAMPYKGLNVVNGMSRYSRDGQYANSGIVAGIHLNELLRREIDPLEALDWLEKIESKFYNYTNNYSAPACRIDDFIADKSGTLNNSTTYPFGLIEADFESLLPKPVFNSLKYGLREFSKKIRGYEDGVMIGLESKTSSPIQVVRDENALIEGFKNLFMAGEGSGFSGGIISSAADGIKAALNIISKD